MIKFDREYIIPAREAKKIYSEVKAIHIKAQHLATEERIRKLLDNTRKEIGELIIKESNNPETEAYAEYEIQDDEDLIKAICEQLKELGYTLYVSDNDDTWPPSKILSIAW